MLIRNGKSKKMGKEMQITFKQTKNIKRVVSSNCRLGGSNMTPPPPDPGCYKCNKCRVACPILKEGVRFTSTNTGKTYKIQQKVNCDSPFIIFELANSSKGNLLVNSPTLLEETLRTQSGN